MVLEEVGDRASRRDHLLRYAIRHHAAVEDREHLPTWRLGARPAAPASTITAESADMSMCTRALARCSGTSAPRRGCHIPDDAVLTGTGARTTSDRRILVPVTRLMMER
jgi:hypothetical protein